MESSKATAKHIRQVTDNLPVAQIQLMCHQHTELLARNYNKHKKVTKQKAQNHRPTEQMSKKPLISERQKSSLIDVSDVATRCMPKDSNVLREYFSAKCVTNLDTSLQSVTKRTNRHKTHSSLGNLRHINYEQGPYTLSKMLIAV